MRLPTPLRRLLHFGLMCAAGTYRALVLVSLVVGSCNAALAARNPVPGRFEQLHDQDLRVATVAYRLAVANKNLCEPVLAPQLGFVLHSLKQYGLADRDEAARSFGLGYEVSVMAVVGGSPAERAGLLAGDRLLAVNGRDLSDHSTNSDPSRASVERAQTILVEEMRRGPAALRVSSPKGVREIRFLADLGCPSNVELIPDDEVNAWADGSRVMIGEGLLRRCGTDDDLALVIGHEMAHNLLHHRRRLAAEGISLSGLLPLSEAGSTEMRGTEEEADRFAVALATTAAYDLSGAETFIGGLMRDGTTKAMTHPDLARRLTLLRAAIADARRGSAHMRLSG